MNGATIKIEAILFSAFVIYAALSVEVELWTKDWHIIVSSFLTYIHNMSIPSWAGVDGFNHIYSLPKSCKACNRLLALKQVFENATLSRNAPRRSVVKRARATSSGKAEIYLRF